MPTLLHLLRTPGRIAAGIAFALTLAACGGSGDAAPATAADKQDAKRPDRTWTDTARVEAIAATLQACSYDGEPVKVDAGRLGGPAPGDCKGMVDKMRPAAKVAAATAVPGWPPRR